MAARAVFGRSCSSDGREHQQQRDRERAHYAGQLRSGARSLRYWCARRTAADREALEEARRDVRDAEAHHLLVRVDRRSQTRGIGSREHAGIGEGYERDGDAACQDRPKLSRGTSGRRGTGSPCGKGPDHGYSRSGCEIEHRRPQRWRAGHGDQHARETRPPLQHENQRERAAADRERRHVRAAAHTFSTMAES